MTKRLGWNYTPAFKAKGTLAAIKGVNTLADLAPQFDVHQPDHELARPAS